MSARSNDLLLRTPSWINGFVVVPLLFFAIASALSQGVQTDGLKYFEILYLKRNELDLLSVVPQASDAALSLVVLSRRSVSITVHVLVCGTVTSPLLRLGGRPRKKRLNCPYNYEFSDFGFDVKDISSP